MKTLSVLRRSSQRHFVAWQTLPVALCLLVSSVRLAAKPADDYARQVSEARLFPNRLVWVGTSLPPAAQSQVLLKDVQIFKTNGVDAGYAALQQFVAAHPQSAWTPDLQVHLAEHDRGRGRYIEALAYWQAAWNETKTNWNPKARKLAVRAFAGWTRLLASLGRKEQLKDLFGELAVLHLPLGVYGTTIEENKEGLAIMNTKPGKSYRCGSFALGHLAMALNSNSKVVQNLFMVDSPDGGFTLTELLALAKTNGLAVEAVHQPAGASLIVPCVVHWKLNHYAAIMEQKNGRYKVEDPTFEHDVWMDAATIEAESSGDFILPKDKVPSSWEKLSQTACSQIYGKGIFGTYEDGDDDGPPDACGNGGGGSNDNNDSTCDPPASNDGAGSGGMPPPPPCPNCGGMPQWYVSEPYITLWLKDTPLLYHQSDQRWMQLGLSYKSRGEAQGISLAGFGDDWSCNWLGRLESQSTAPDSIVDHLAGGGVRSFLTDGTLDYKTLRQFAWSSIGGGDPPVLIAPSGSENVYNYTNGYVSGTTNYLLTERLDRYGRVLQRFNYQSVSGVTRLVSVVDMDGRTNTLAYGNSSYPNLITSVTDPYGRTAYFNYNSQGLLTNIVDAEGMSTYFQYDGSENITNMVTLYGTTEFQYFNSVDANENNAPERAILITEASGDHQLYEHPDYTFTDGDRVTYHWNRKQYEAISAQGKADVFAMTEADYQLASVKSWLYTGLTNSLGIFSDTLEWSADPYELIQNQNQRPNRIQYQYPGENGDFIGTMKRITVLSTPDSSVSITRNSLGRPTSYTYHNSDGSQALYTNIFDPTGTILEYELGPDGELTRGYGYDPVVPNLLVSVTNAVGDVIRYTHDPTMLKVTSITFPGGMVRTNLYYTTGPEAGFLTQQIDIGFRTNSFGWQDGNLVVETNELGLVTTYTYDNLNRLTSIGYPDGTTVSNVYDKLDIVATKDRLNQWTHYGYNDVRQLMAITNVDHQVTTFDYCGCGSPDEIIRWNGTAPFTTTFSYNMGGLLTNAVYPDNYQLSYTYDDRNRVQTITDGTGNELDVSWYEHGVQSQPQSATLGGQQLFSQQFDPYGRVLQSTDRNGVTVTNAYDFLDRLIARRFLGSDGVTQSGLESFGYSALGLTSYNDQLGHQTTFVRDLAGRVIAETDANTEALHFTYNPADELLTLTDGKNQNTSWNYDEFGHVTNKVDDAGITDFVYHYDADSRLTSRWTPAKGTTVYRYDPLGNLTNVDYSGGTVYTPSIYFAYDPLNRLTNMLDGIGSTAFTWTPGDQLAGETGPWADDTVSYTYNTARQRASFSLLQPNGPTWTQSYSYDAMMRLASVNSPAGGSLVSPSGEFDYSYSGGMDRPSSISMPGGDSYHAGFDALARFNTVYFNSTLLGRVDQHQYAYDAGSEVTQQVFAFANSAYSYINYTYDNIGQLKTAQGFEQTGIVRLPEQFSYAYDQAWNLNSRTENAVVETFNVNDLNELTNTTINTPIRPLIAGSTTEIGTNVTSVTVNGLAATVYADGTFATTNVALSNGWNTLTADAHDGYGRASSASIRVNYAGSAAYTYDANGNLVSDGTRNFAYDDENQLVGVSVANTWSNGFAYDGLLRKRIERDYSWNGGSWVETNEVRYIYDGDLVLQERDGNNLPQTTYTRGIDLSGTLQGAGGIGGLLARSDRMSKIPMIIFPGNPHPQYVNTSYYFSDGQGNVTALVAPNGVLLAHYEYDPYGNMLSMSGPMAGANKYRFSSKEWDDNSGLYYYGFRFYDPNLQRWPNRDPMGDPVGTLNLVTAIMPDIDSPTLFDRSIDFKMENDSLNDTASLNDWSEVNANLFAGIANDPINQADPFGLDANSYAGCIEHYRNPITEQLPNAIAEAIDKHFGSGNGSGNGPHVPGWVPPAAYGANALGNLAVGKVPAALGRAAHPTTWEHVLGSKFGTVGSRIGKFAGHAAIVLTVAEGFWDLGLLGGCGIAQAIGD